MQRGLFPRDVDNPADEAEHQVKGDVDQGEGNRRLGGDAVKLEYFDIGAFPEPQAVDGDGDDLDDQDDGDEDEVVDEMDIQVEGQSDQEIVEDDVELEEHGPDGRPEKGSLLGAVVQDGLPEEKEFAAEPVEESSEPEGAKKAGKNREEKDGDQGKAEKAQEEGYPNDRNLAGHVEPEQRSDNSHEEEDDDAGEPVDQDDGGGFDQRPGIARAVPDADDIAPETGGEEIVEELGDEIGLGQEAEGNLISLGAGQDLPTVGAGEEPEGVEREGQGQPVGVDTPEDVSDLAEGGLGGQDQDEYGQADGQLEQKEESIFSVGHFNQRFFTINSCSCICCIVAEAFP